MPSTTPNAPTINFGNIPGSPNAQPPIIPNPNFNLGKNMSIGQFGQGGTSSPLTAPTTGGNIMGITYGTGTQTNVPQGFSVPSNIPAGTSPPIANPGNPQGAGNPATPQGANGVMVNGQFYANGATGAKAPQGYEYGPDGKLQPLQPAAPLNISGSTNTTSNVSNFAGNPNGASELYAALTKNLENYQSVSQQNDQELQAQQALLNSISQTQNAQVSSKAFDLATQGQQLGWYGRGVPLGLAQSQYQNVGFGAQVQQGLNQLSITQAQNAQNLAQQGLGLQQQNRQIRTQAAYQGLQGALGIGGLAQQGNIAQLPYQNLTADQKLALELQYYQATGQMPNFSGTGPSSAFTSMQNNGSTVPTMQTGNILGYNLSSYATDPQYQNKVMSAIGTMPDAMTTPTSIQSWIDQNYKNSPITGQMIMAASSSAGVSPKALAGILAVESQMGTDGSSGAKMNNPGNYGNSDSAMAAGTPTGFGSMQEGINHVAQWLAQHPAQGQQNQVGQATDNSQIIDTVKSYFPMAIQNGVRTTASGIPYVDLSEVPDAMKTAATSIAAQHGVKAFTPDQASGMKALDSIGLALNQMTQLATSELMPANGGLGTAGNIIKNWWGSITGTNPKLADFSLQKDSAIKAVQALAGGAGSGLRLNTGTIEAAVSNLPTQNDSQEAALEKIQKTRDLLYNQMAVAFGNPALANGMIQQNGHSFMPGDTVTNSNGQLGVLNQDGTITPQSSQ